MRQIAVQIFINQTTGSALFKIFHHTELRRRHEGIIEFPENSTEDKILDEVYRIFNVAHPAGYAGASLSVADVITLDNTRSYEVATFGFEQLDFIVTGDPYVVNLPEPTISQIKTWRQIAYRNSQPSGIEDFYRSYNICRRCRGKDHMTGYPPKSCPTCQGTGTYPATEDERILTSLRNMTRPLKSKNQRRHAT